jgi:hypothetical protein
MRRPVLLIALAIIILGLGLLGGWYLHYRSTPGYALHQAVAALETRDLDKFFKYLDLKEILNNMLKASSRDLIPESPKDDEWDRQMKGLGRNLARLLAPKLIQSLEKELKIEIKKSLASLDTPKILAIHALVAGAKIETAGDEARVTLKDPKTKDTFQFRMQRFPAADNGGWRIVAINYQDLKKFSRRYLGDRPK